MLDWVEHIKRLGATCVLFNPLFESDAHGYDTRDYNKVDCRLGTNDDLRQVCAALHAAGIKILFDGVFNHVGRGFWAFKDVQEKRWDSPYKDWFRIDFGGNSAYNDGFFYSVGFGRIAERTYEIAKSVALLHHGKFCRRISDLLHHNGNRAVRSRIIANCERNSLAIGVHSQYDKLPRKAMFCNEWCVNHVLVHVWRKAFF